MMRPSAFTVPLAMLVFSATSAMAGPAGDGARARIASIAQGDIAAVTGVYAPNARLQWVGGPLDGAYEGSEALRAVWSKFFTAQGPQQVSITNLSEGSNPKGTTVAADVSFTGKAKVKVLYVLVYRDGKLVDEIWQVNPAVAP